MLSEKLFQAAWPQVLGAPGIATRSKDATRLEAIAIRSKDATRGSWPYY